MIRNLIFGAIAVGLILLYGGIAARVGPVVGPSASEPTPTPTSPAERTGAPRVPGAIAFALRGDVYVLRDGRYAPLTSEGRNSQPHLAADGFVYFARSETIDGRSIADGQVVNARLAYTTVVRKPAGGGPEEIVVDGLLQESANGFHRVAWYAGPAVDPGAERLALTVSPAFGTADLQVVSLAAVGPGRPAVLPLSQGAELADPAWSPDGASLAVTTYNTPTPGILLWDADAPGVATRLEALPEGEAYRPSFSADGEWLVYTLRDGGQSDVHAFEIATERDVALTSDGRSWNGVFSPDGGWVAFLRESEGVIDLYAMELGDALDRGEAKEPVKLTAGEGIDGASRPSWGD